MPFSCFSSAIIMKFNLDFKPIPICSSISLPLSPLLHLLFFMLLLLKSFYFEGILGCFLFAFFSTISLSTVIIQVLCQSFSGSNRLFLSSFFMFLSRYDEELHTCCAFMSLTTLLFIRIFYW